MPMKQDSAMVELVKPLNLVAPSSNPNLSSSSMAQKPISVVANSVSLKRCLALWPMPSLGNGGD